MNCKWDFFFFKFQLLSLVRKMFLFLHQIQYKIKIYIKICTNRKVLQLIGFLKRYFTKTMDLLYELKWTLALSEICTKYKSTGLDSDKYC